MKPKSCQRTASRRAAPAFAVATLLALGLSGSDAALAASGDIAHPFLVVKPAEIAALRTRASQQPFAAMKTAARNSAAKTLPNEATSDANIRSRALLMNEIMSSAALSYLLEPDTAVRKTYRDKIISQMVYWDATRTGSLSAHYLWQNPPMQSWDYMTPTSAAFFQTILALDIVYNDLTPAQRQQFDGWLAVPGTFYTQREINWVTAGLGARGIWAMYTANSAVANATKTLYIADTEAMMSPDGPFVEGTGYAIARWFNPDREQKSSFGDVLRYTGLIANDQWYGNPRFRNFQEWINGYAFTPSRDSWGMGDGGIQRFASWMMNAHRSGRFSAAAGAYEAWLKQGFNPGGRLTAYIFTDPPPAGGGRAAPGRIFASGGAYFRQQPAAGTTDLAGVLHNVRYEGDYRGHMHKEVNAIYLAGYGAVLLGGSGYNNWAQSFSGYAWEYINRRAVSGNVGLIDYDLTRSGGTTFLPSATNDHRDTEIDRVSGSFFGGDGKFGGGVSGIVSGVVDIATGTTAGTRNGGVALDALPNGNHVRHFFFIQPQDGKSGYFAAVDTLTANAGYQALTPPLSAHLVWHPNSDQLTTASAATEFQWRIDGIDNVNLAVYLATAPSAARTYDGALADRLVGRYLFATYAADAARRVQAATVLYPYTVAPTHPKATFARISGSNFSGATVDSGGGVIDYVVESRANAVVAPQADASVRGTGIVYRRNGTAVKFYAGVAARQVRIGALGFTSTQDVTLAVRDRRGTIKVPAGGATLSLYYPGITAVRVGNTRTASTVAGRVDVNLAAGSFAFELLTGDNIAASDFEDVQ